MKKLKPFAVFFCLSQIAVFARDGDLFKAKILVADIINPSVEIEIRPTKDLGLLYPTNVPVSLLPPLAAPINWLPTNSFCGPIQLTDENGNQIQLLKPDVCSSNNYPARFNFVEYYNRWWGQISKHPYPDMGVLPPGGNFNGFSFGTNFFSCHKFYVKDYFKLKKSGEYSLVVWPKLYLIASTNQGEQCLNRVDLAPVSVRFRYEK